MRRIPLSRRSHITSFRPISGKAVEHESALERNFVTLTSFLDADVTITSQPVTIWFGDGTPRRYTPDFLVAWSNGRLELIEVKYRADLHAQWARWDDIDDNLRARLLHTMGHGRTPRPPRPTRWSAWLARLDAAEFARQRTARTARISTRSAVGDCRRARWQADRGRR